MEKSNLKKLKEAEVKEKYHLQISKRFAALEILDGSRDINSAWGNISGNIKVSVKESLVITFGSTIKSVAKKLLKISDQRKPAELEWL
jgi:hypothetical protein